MFGLEKLGSLGAGANDRADPVILSKEEIDRRRKLAQALMEKGSDTSPVQHWTQGAARFAQALHGVAEDWGAARADRDAQDAGKKISDEMATLMSGGSATTSATQVAPQATNSLSAPGGIPKLATGDAYDPKLVEGRSFASTDETGANLGEFLEGNAKQRGLTNPVFSSRLLGFLNDNPHGVALSSLDRTPEQQAALYARYQRGEGAPAAAPGKSKHNHGLAADLSYESPEAKQWAIQNAGRYGLTFPLLNMGAKSEDWHIEPIGARGTAQQAQAAPVKVASNDPNFMPQRAASSPAAGATPQDAQAAPAAPVQVAQASQQQGGIPSLAKLLALRNNPAFDRAPAGTQAVVNAMIQKAVTQEAKDPLDAEKKRLEIQNLRNSVGNADLDREGKRLGIEKQRRDLSAVEFDRIQDQTGTFWERRKGTADPWQQVSGPTGKNKSAVADVEDRKVAAESIGIKPDDPAYKSYIATGKMPREDAQPLSATDKKAIIEADETIAASKSTIQALERAKQLSKEAYSGPLASKRAYVSSFFGSDEGKKTLELDNLVTAQALENLKATFGSAPTEGERKILLDIQGSSNQPPDVRERIFQRAIDAANRRIKFNEDRAAQLRGGTYYKAPQQQQAQPQGSPRPQQQNGPRILSVEPIR